MRVDPLFPRLPSRVGNVTLFTARGHAAKLSVGAQMRGVVTRVDSLAGPASRIVHEGCKSPTRWNTALPRASAGRAGTGDTAPTRSRGRHLSLV
ncbi:hypothetical protein HYQ46_004527 [Verticillium longisporum]|nr:hypothetical protein HYQ46_004527 [Verticillium longisporum]